MWIAHFDDGKGKFQSHEMSFKEDGRFNKTLDGDTLIWSHDISDITVYGESKEECMKKLENALDYLLAELEALRSNIVADIVPINEVDCIGNKLDNMEDHKHECK